MKRYTSKNETGANILELKPDNPTWVVSQGKELNYKISGDAIDKFAEYEDLAEPMKIKEIHVDEYYCPACGSENSCNNKKVEHKFCPNCGQRIVS